MEFYTHQQPQQQQSTQQVDSMANVVVVGASSANTTTTNSSTSANNLINSSNNNSTPPTVSAISGVSSSSSSAVSTADAATVAIAKDMLQLHHGGGGSGNAAVNNNNGNTVAAAAESNSVAAAAAASASAIQNIPPAHLNATARGGDSPDNALGFLKFEQDLLYIREAYTIIGRNSSTSHVHFHVAENNLVSRKHFQVFFDPEAREFYVQCLSKNGIFVDDFLQRRNADPLQLPNSCFFRFPSTEIRIQFESFLHNGSVGVQPAGNALSGTASSSATAGNALQLHQQHNNSSGNSSNHVYPTALISHMGDGGGSGAGGGGGGVVPNAHVIVSPMSISEDHLLQPHQQHQQSSSIVSSSGGPSTCAASHLLPTDNSNVVYSPLKISIPKKEQKSPYLSPTGTISAANSCPASPRQSFHQNQANYNNNYGNNNLQNQDLFQTPSTASYNHNEKPPYSYAQLIVQAISAAPDKQLTLSGIYSFIVKHYPYYRKETNKGWQNSIRHNLSLNRYFIKVARSQDEPGKGSFWRIDPDSGAKLIDHSYKKRRQRSSQGFRPSYGMPRSAPVSPSHMDTSRESSPLQDIVLQSAPGSPGMSIENRATDGDLMYNTQNMHQTAAANNSQNQYNSGSPYYVSNQNNSVIGIAAGAGQQQQQQLQQQSHAESGGNGVGALIALKRNHVMAAGAANAGNIVMGMGHQQQQQQQQQQMQLQQQQQPLHPDIIYEEMPTDYSGNMESGDDECDAKRSKYLSDAL